MKCPKCNYTSFDYNRTCPKCGNDNGEEQARLKFSPNKPNPPFFLASLLGTAGSETSAIRGGRRMGASASVYGEMEAQDLLIALDDLDMDDARPDFKKTPHLSEDEIVFETDDSRKEPLSPLGPADDEILFDLEPASEENEMDISDRDPLDKKAFLDQGSDEPPIVVEMPKTEPKKTASLTPEGADQAQEMDLFLDDDTGSPETASEDTGFVAPSPDVQETDSPELFLSLDDLPETTPKPTPPAPDDEILFELEDASEEGGETAKEKIAGKKGFWDSDEINQQMAVFEIEESDGKHKPASPKGTDDGEKEVNLFSDLDIEPLDLELSLEDVDKKPE